MKEGLMKKLLIVAMSVLMAMGVCFGIGLWRDASQKSLTAAADSYATEADLAAL